MKKTCQDHNFKRSVWFNNILDFLLGTCRANCWSFRFKVCRHGKGNCPLGSELYNQLLVDVYLIQIWFETLEAKSCTITILLLMQRSRVSAINLSYLYLSTNKKTLQASSFAAASPSLPKRPFLGMSYYLPCP